MAWTTFPTLTDGQIFTGAHTQIIRDNFAETAAAKATTAGSIFVGTGANTLVERIPQRTTNATAQTSVTTAAYGDLATVGPFSTATTGTQAIVYWGAAMGNATAGGGCLMGFAVSGSSAIAATDAQAMRSMSASAGETNRFTAMHMQITMTAGSNTFTAKYTTPTGGTATFQQRELGVIPL